MSVPIREWMSESPCCVQPDTAACDALDLMSERGIRHVAVVDEQLRPLGVVCADDLRAALAGPRDATSEAVPLVAELMSHAPFTVRESDSLEGAAELITRWRIDFLSVLDDRGALCGSLCETDLLRALAALVRPDREGRRRSELEQLVDGLRRERDTLRMRIAYRRAVQRTLVDERLVGAAWARLEALERALERAAQGKLDRCARCSQPIPLPRLRALPLARHCIPCSST